MLKRIKEIPLLAYPTSFPNGLPVFNDRICVLEGKQLELVGIDKKSIVVDIGGEVFPNFVCTGDEIYALTGSVRNPQIIRISEKLQVEIVEEKPKFGRLLYLDIDFDGKEEVVFLSFRDVFIVERNRVSKLFSFSKLVDPLWLQVDLEENLTYVLPSLGNNKILIFDQNGKFIRKVSFGSWYSRFLPYANARFFLLRKEGDLFLIMLNYPKFPGAFAIKNLSKKYLWKMKLHYPGILVDIDCDGEPELISFSSRRRSFRDLIAVDNILSDKPQIIQRHTNFAKFVTTCDLSSYDSDLYVLADKKLHIFRIKSQF